MANSQCRMGARKEIPAAILPQQLAEAERELLDRAGRYEGFDCLTELTLDALKDVTARHDIDFATALLYHRLCTSRQHGEFIEEVATRARHGSERIGNIDADFVVVPGAMYHEYPAAGGDGRQMRGQASSFGCHTDLIPTVSSGSLEQNAQLICDWLARQGDRRIILASLSKGGADIKVALQQPGAADAFRNVVAWINVSGILSGSPAVTWLRRHRLHWAFYRAMFLLRGYDFRVISDMRAGPAAPLDFPLQLPDHITLVSLLGFPLGRHVSTGLARRCYQRIAPEGPNDAVVCLAEAAALPGYIYPTWGADHYLRPGWDMRRVAHALTAWLANRLDLWSTT